MAGKLSLVGIGISGERGISLEGLDELMSCERVFAENYTNIQPKGTLDRLSKMCKKEITVLSRELVEGEKEILNAAMEKAVALVVAGDPMIATTHVSLLLAAKKRGIETKIFHASSILPAAAGEAGLQVYKFGKTVTLAYWRENYKPMAAYDVVSENLSRGLHTLLLLDIDEKLGPMAPSVAAETLVMMENEGKKGIFAPHAMVVILRGIGWGKPVKKYCDIASIGDGGEGPAAIIVPAKLHFLEEESLQSLS
ncbi:MAG: diphthine synthase [Candidatus Micrarchaeia archaeon]|jgi:diphthine synthase